MSEAMLIAVVAGSFSIVTSLITTFTTLSARRSNQRWQRRTAELIRTYRDIAAFHRLEGLYTEALATEERSAESWKKSVRRELRESGHDSPSERATTLESEQRIARLS